MNNITKLLISSAIVVSCSGCGQFSYKLNSTGQVNCYNVEGSVIDTPTVSDSLYGQDANFGYGAQMNFVDNGDGTITDKNTGLTWQQTPPTDGMSWAEAKEYCENLELGGDSDWRLPTLKELFSISDFSEGWPYIDTTYFKLASGYVDKNEQYWADNKYTGETLEGRNNAAFGVNHVTGHIKAYPAGSGMPPRGEGDTRGSREMPQGQSPNGEESVPPPPLRENDDANNGTHNRGHQRPPMGQREGGDSTMMRGGRPPMGQRGEGDSTMIRGGRPPMGQRGEGDSTMIRGGRPPMEDNQMNRQQGRPNTPQPQQQNQNRRNSPMDKQVRAVKGNPYGQNNFVDNGDGTITDRATGLMWAQFDNGEGVEWVDALMYAKESTLAGHNDWRIPNVKELQSIVDYTKAPSSKTTEAAIDSRFFNCTPFVNEAGDDDFGYYWSSTSARFRIGQPFYFAWYVAFGRAVNNAGIDMHGAGAVRFDSKSDNGIAVEGGEERYYNFVRIVRNISTD